MRSKLRAPVLQNLFNFVHKPTPADSKPALASSPSKVRAYETCPCRQCRHARRLDRMEPLSGRDELWVYGFLLAGVGLWALILWAVL
jgi:hypothetical protein